MRRKLLVSALTSILLVIFLYQQIALRNVPVPDTVVWNGDETWLMREFQTQATTGRFAYPEALGSTVAIGSGVIFNNMWITAILYGVPAAIAGPDPVAVGRAVSSLLAAVLLWVLYREGRRANIDRSLVLASLILLVATDSFTYNGHSARYDVISSLAVVLGFAIILRLLRRQARTSDYALGAMIPATLLISPHVMLCLGIAIGAAILIRTKRNGMAAVLRAAVGGIGAAAIIIGLYALTGNSDWTLLGPMELGGNHLANTAGYFPLLHDIGVRYVFAEILRRLTTLRYYALPIELALGLALIAAIAFRTGGRRVVTCYEFVIGAVIMVSFYTFETHDVRAVIYTLPMLALGLMALLHLIHQRHPRLAVAIALLPVIYAIPAFVVRGEHARHLGDRLVRASNAAYDSVRMTLGSQQGHTLIDSHGMTYLVTARELHPMTDLFAWHSSTGDSIPTVLARYNVRYVVRIKAFGHVDETSYRRDLDRYLDAQTKEVRRIVGPFSDYRVSYRTGQKEGLDTILVSELR